MMRVMRVLVFPLGGGRRERLDLTLSDAGHADMVAMCAGTGGGSGYSGNMDGGTLGGSAPPAMAVDGGTL